MDYTTVPVWGNGGQYSGAHGGSSDVGHVQNYVLIEHFRVICRWGGGEPDLGEDTDNQSPYKFS